MRNNKYILSTGLLSLLSLAAHAQNAFSSLVLSSHKYLVTTAVILIIFAGIAIFLIRLERKLKKIEKNL